MIASALAVGLLFGGVADAQCISSYQEAKYAVSKETGWTYFQDTVREIVPQQDGSALVSFKKSSRRFLIAKSDEAFRKAAETSLKKKSSVHVAVQEGESEDPRSDAGPAQIKWVDAKLQHPSCR